MRPQMLTTKATAEVSPTTQGTGVRDIGILRVSAMYRQRKMQKASSVGSAVAVVSLSAGDYGQR